jgi:hypothetical protein
VLLVLPIAVLLAAGCSDEVLTVDEQNVAVCLPPEAGASPTGRMDVEFRQDGKVVGTASSDFGSAVGARVPTGDIDVFVNGELHGRASAAGPSPLDEDGKLRGGTYLSGPGCPEKPPFD